MLIEFPADDPARALRFWEGVLGRPLAPRTAEQGEGWQTGGDGPAVGVHARAVGPGRPGLPPLLPRGRRPRGPRPRRGARRRGDPRGRAVGHLPRLRGQPLRPRPARLASPGRPVGVEHQGHRPVVLEATRPCARRSAPGRRARRGPPPPPRRPPRAARPRSPGAAADHDGRLPLRTSPSSVNWLTQSRPPPGTSVSGQVERALRAVEQAQPHGLGGQALGLRGGVAAGGADQGEQARARWRRPPRPSTWTRAQRTRWRTIRTAAMRTGRRVASPRWTRPRRASPTTSRRSAPTPSATGERGGACGCPRRSAAR